MLNVSLGGGFWITWSHTPSLVTTHFLLYFLTLPPPFIVESPSPLNIYIPRSQFQAIDSPTFWQCICLNTSPISQQT